MNIIQVRKKRHWFIDDEWIAEYSNGEGYLFQYGYKTSSKRFKTLRELLAWANKESSWIDCFPGGGYGIGVQVWLDEYVIAEFWNFTSEKYEKSIRIEKIYLGDKYANMKTFDETWKQVELESKQEVVSE